MFDWNDQDQVGDTIWGDFSESEDHIVPYPKGIEENSLCTFGDYNKKQRTEEASSVIRSAEQASGAKNDLPECNFENKSGFNRNEELSAPRLDMDIWPDIPSLNAALNKGYNDENDQDPLDTGLVNTFTEASNMNMVRVQLDGPPELLVSEHEDKESDNFLDCDWANIDDFDDLDRIFRNSESIFYHGMGGNGDEFLSLSTGVLSGNAPSIPLPDIPSKEDQISDQGCSSFHYGEHSGGKRKPNEKTADHSMKTEEQTASQTHLTREYHGMPNQSSEKVDGQKKLQRYQKKSEERSKSKASQNFNGAWSYNLNKTPEVVARKMHASLTTTPLQTFQPPTISQQRQFSGTEFIAYPSSSSQLMFSGYSFPTYPYPAIPHMPHVHAERNKRRSASVGYKYYLDPSKNSETMNKLSDVSKPLTMTPQEKVEKLRRRQQMQAMLAIQQQRQQFGHQISSTESLVSQESIQKNQCQDAVACTLAVDENANKFPSSELTMLEKDESQGVVMMVDDHSLAETIYNQLQDALEKLDIKVRLSIRDSLFRLARNATERQNASDRSSTNRSDRDEDEVALNEQHNHHDRSSKLSDTETNTNPIDRTVAHLLFHRPSASCPRPVKEEIPNSPNSCNRVLRPSLNTCGSTSEEQQRKYEEMEVQPPP